MIGRTKSSFKTFENIVIGVVDSAARHRTVDAGFDDGRSASSVKTADSRVLSRKWVPKTV